MRRFLLLFFSIILLWLLFPSSIKAAENCETIFGGTCKVVCSPDERDLGTTYCLQPRETIRTCCLPKDEPVPKKSCGEPCMGAAECPSNCPACMEQVQGQGKVCRVAGPIEPAPECIPTAIGCIDVKSPEGFVSNILTLAIGIGGGIAMLLIIFGGIQILTSAGNPEKIQAGKELITSAIAGLLLIVFSVFILRIIGVEVLNIFE